MIGRRELSLILGLSVLSGCTTTSTPKTQKLPIKWMLGDGLCEPETIVHDAVKDILIVSNICGFKANGEGYLSLVDLDGTLKVQKWVTSLNAPAGMAIHNRELYVTNLDRVEIINLDTGVKIKSLEPNPKFRAVNDIAVSDAGDVFITESALGQVFVVKSGNYNPFPDAAAGFKFANGLHVSRDYLYIGGEHLWRLNLESEAIDIIQPDHIADVDGIESDGMGGLIVSEVGGDLWHIPKHGALERWTSDGLSSTNHVYISGQNMIIIPTGYDNTLLAIDAPK